MAGVRTKESPFTPGRPVPIEYFVARVKEIQRLERAIKQASSERNENIFITGERGIGKSSLASFIRYIAEKEYNFVGTHCHLGGTKDVEGMIRIIFQRLLQGIPDKSIFDKLKSIFGKYIKEITLFGVGVEFTTDQSELRTLLDNFIPFMREIWKNVKTQKNGIILILDDLNGITGISEFAHFMKSFVDELATAKQTFPLLLILVGIQERREDLIRHQPSVVRIFDIIELPPMTNGESTGFFKKTFEKQSISFEPLALSEMVRYSGGLPMLMHEVGDAVFWVDQDDFIDERDAMDGILLAAENVGRKYLDPQVYSVIKSNTYRSILRKLGKLPLGMSFVRGGIIEKMSGSERKNFDNFLRRTEGLGIITKGEGRGEYGFVNQLFHLYVLLEAFKADKEKKIKNKSK